MKINKEDLDRNFWFEDMDGNIISREDADKLDGVTYHSMWALEITEHMDSYEWKPQTILQKHLCLIKPIRRWMNKKHFHEKTFNRLVDFNTHISGGNEELILAMANSGDYTLSQAILLLATSCERCMNVLAYKYLNGKDGYEEFSEEWKKCNTVCKYCEGIGEEE